MSQGHGERLSSTDAAFLRMESRTLPMHVGGLFVFAPPADDALDFGRFVRLVRSRLHLVPRCRQRPVAPPFGLHQPVWVDDRHFDLSFHVRHAALPRPGTLDQLTEYATRVLSRPLDRTRPLWELYYIEGLEDGGFALLAKSHHAMIDERAGTDLATVLLDLSPDGSDELPDPEPWTPEPTPSSLTLAREALLDLAATPTAVVESGRRVARAPWSAARRSLDLGMGTASMLRESLAHPPPRSLLNAAPGAHRRLVVQQAPLADLKQVKDALRTTVNDVVLAIVADATGRYLRSQGARTDGVWQRAMVPVSTRAVTDEEAPGAQVVAAFVDLPMFEMDPVERLHVCHEGMADVRSSHHAVGARFLVGLSGFAPPTLHAMAARLAARGRVFNFLVTNVPGPQVPIYCLGARLQGSFPFTSLAPNQSYSVGLTSIDGWLNFGITTDYDAIPDAGRIGGYLRSALEELLEHAAAARERGTAALPGGARGTAE